MPPLFHPAAYDSGRFPDSYWRSSVAERPADDPLEGDESCDVAVIGGGYTGLSTALHLARDHGVDVRVLEAGSPGWGASGRNGGFCCMGAAKLSASRMLSLFGVEETRRYFTMQREAVELVADLARAEEIDFDRQGDGVLEVAHRPSRMAELEEDARLDRELAGLDSTIWTSAELAERGFVGPEAHGALHRPAGFGLHPLKYHHGLLAAARRHGARIHHRSRVAGWEREGGRHRLLTKGGALGARRVVIATNGYTEDELHPALAGTFLPAFSNILTTRPLTPGERAAQGWLTEMPVSDTRRLLFYFRMLKDGRFLLGARGDTHGGPAAADRMKGWLHRRLGEMFPAWAGVEVSHFWTGLVCLSANLTPMVGHLADDPGVYYGLAYHGNGVASATWTGRALARMIAGGNEQLPAPVAHPPRRFPAPALRAWYLRAAYLGYRVRDAL